MVNYTPQDINLIFKTGSEGFGANARREEQNDMDIVRVISRSGRVCTVKTGGAHEGIFKVDNIGGFVACSEKPPAPLGIDWQGPEPDKGSSVLVSIVAAPQVAALRPDLKVYVPDTGPESAVRDDKGQIIGVRRLIDWSTETKALPGRPVFSGRSEYCTVALNMTPHEVRSISERGDLTLSTCGQVPRVKMTQESLGLAAFTVGEVHTWDMQIPLASRPAVSGLEWNGPEPAEGQTIIVSLLAAPAIVEARPDLKVLVPDTGPDSVIRNEDGSIRGVSRFVRHSRYPGERFFDLALSAGARPGWPEEPKDAYYLALVVGANPTGEYNDMLTLMGGFDTEEAAGGSGSIAHCCENVTSWNREAGTSFGPVYLCRVGQMGPVRSFDVEK